MSEAKMLELRQEIAALSVHKNARRFTAPLRAKVTRWARRRLAAGVAMTQICAELDVSEPTLRRFLEAKRTSRRSPAPTRGFTQLRVVGRAAHAPATTSPLLLRGPLGVVVEGLSVEDLSRLLRELSCSV